MFKMSYTLKRGSSEYRTSYPNPGDENHNIFVFKGKNGLGKSTAMQILSLGMFGLDSDDINLEIKSMMKRLIAEDTEEFNFNYEIKSLDETIKIRSSLKDINISGLRVFLNDVPVNKTAFSDKFQLIFDVPDNIMKKLNSSLVSIKKDISDCIDYTKKYSRNIQDEYEKLRVYNERTKRMKELEDRLKEENVELENYKQRWNSVNENYQKLRKLYVFKKYNEWDYQIENFLKEQKDLEKKVNPKIQKSKQTKYSTSKENFYEFLNEIKNKLNDVRRSQEDFEAIENSVELRLLLKDIEHCNDIDDFSEKFFDKYILSLREICNKLSNDERNKPTKDDGELDLIKTIIPILKNYITINPEIPGTNGKSLNQFLEELENRKNYLDSNLSNKRRFLSIKQNLCDLRSNFEELRTKWRKLSSNEEVTPEDEQRLKDRIVELDKILENLAKKQEAISSEYNSLSEKERLGDYKYFDEREYAESDKEYNFLKTEIDKMRNQTELTQQLLDEHNRTSSKPPDYKEEQLDFRSKIANNLLEKLNRWPKLLTDIDVTNIDVTNIVLTKNKDPDSDIQFFDALGGYLANILENIFHGDRKWMLKKIDLLNSTFIVDGGPPIKFLDISTGYSALNSLFAKIKQSYGGRKKILLLDEIGIMDTGNIERLLTEIKKQVRSGEVIFAALNLARDLDHVVVDSIDV